MLKAAFFAIVLFVTMSFSQPTFLELTDCPYKVQSYDSNNVLIEESFITYDQLHRPLKVTSDGDSMWTVYAQHGDTLYEIYHYGMSSDTDYEKIVTPANGKPTVSLHFDNNNFMDEKDSCIYDGAQRLIKIRIKNYGDFSSGDSLIYVYNAANEAIQIRQYGDGALWGIEDFQYDDKGRIRRYSSRDCETCKSDGYDLYLYNDNSVRWIAGSGSAQGKENGVTIHSVGNRINISILDEKLSVRSCKIISMDGKKVFRTMALDNMETNKISFQLPGGLGHANNIVSIGLNNGVIINSMVKNKF
jgi:hypothetical protein